MTVTLDPAAKPEKSIDFKIDEAPDDAKGKTCKGIYKLDGNDKMTFCFRAEGDRPTKYEMVCFEQIVTELTPPRIDAREPFAAQRLESNDDVATHGELIALGTVVKRLGAVGVVEPNFRSNEHPGRDVADVADRMLEVRRGVSGPEALEVGQAIISEHDVRLVVELIRRVVHDTKRVGQAGDSCAGADCLEVGLGRTVGHGSSRQCIALPEIIHLGERV